MNEGPNEQTTDRMFNLPTDQEAGVQGSYANARKELMHVRFARLFESRRPDQKRFSFFIFLLYPN